MRLLTPLLCLFILSLASCASAPKAAPPSFAGTWEVVISNTPLGTVPGTLAIVTGAERLTGSFKSQGATYPLTSATATDNSLQVSFYFPDQDMNVDMNLQGPPTDDALQGQTLGEYRTSASRRAAPSQE